MKKFYTTVFVLFLIFISTAAFAGGDKNAVARRIAVAESRCNAGCKSGVTADMSDALGANYDFLDKELNVVYKKLMSVLPQDKKNVLKNSERNWIKQRDKKADKAAAEFGDGSMARVTYTDMLCQETKKRVLYLADYYDKVTAGKTR